MAPPDYPRPDAECWWGIDGIDAMCWADGIPYEYQGDER